MEELMVGLIVLGAALYLARWFFRNLIARGKVATCDSCDSCETSESSDIEKTQGVSSP